MFLGYDNAKMPSYYRDYFFCHQALQKRKSTDSTKVNVDSRVVVHHMI